MSGTGENDAQRLSELRNRIDAIDAEMHRLLMARGAVIDELIHTKRTERPGAAFRPGREADMMRRLVARHEGVLPLTTVEHLWREIITTFTRMQARFDVAFDASHEAQRMQDVARFTFGFSVNLLPLPSPAAVVAHVAASGDLGLVACAAGPEAGAWWRGLARPSAPRIMAVLPHIGVAERPADLPAFVISPPLSDPTPPEIRLHAISAKATYQPAGDSVVLASVEEEGRREMLVAVPAARDAATLAAEAMGRIEAVSEIGGIARGITIDGATSLLYQKPRKAEENP